MRVSAKLICVFWPPLGACGRICAVGVILVGVRL